MSLTKALEDLDSNVIDPDDPEAGCPTCRLETMRHINIVRNYLNVFVTELLKRSNQHDQSKLQSPEVEVFDEFTPKLKDCEYGSDEYKSYLKAMKPALDHHYSVHRHHPEHFENGMMGMDLIDLCELVCDWHAASLRHKTGDIHTSIELNQERFGYDDQIKQLLRNTAQRLDRLASHQ